MVVGEGQQEPTGLTVQVESADSYCRAAACTSTSQNGHTQQQQRCLGCLTARAGYVPNPSEQSIAKTHSPWCKDNFW